MEREFRIRRSQFPEKALPLLENAAGKVKKLRFYKEVDSIGSNYKAKFKKDRLWYSMEFSENGELEDIGITIEEVDVPNDSWSNILAHLKKDSTKYRILRIQQQYPVAGNRTEAITLKNAFQNLLLPYINYEIMVSKKGKNGYRDHEVLFDAMGNFISSKKSLPPNYGHILY
jgi:hypothetical protein